MKRLKTLMKEINDHFKKPDCIGGVNNLDCCHPDPEDKTMLNVHTENGHYCHDYYGEFSEDCWVDPKLEKMIKDAGWSFDWKYPGAITLFKD